MLWRTIAEGYDAINAHIQRLSRHLSAAEARRALEEAHRAVVGRVATMSVAERWAVRDPRSVTQALADARCPPLAILSRVAPRSGGTMGLQLEAQPLPLATDVDGAVRVGGTRVTLDSVVHAFNQGATAEEIAQQYASLRLQDVYAIIAYYLDARAEVDTYLRQRGQEAAAVRTENERRFDPSGIRERLMARRSG